jgi:hypothetical protein
LQADNGAKTYTLDKVFLLAEKNVNQNFHDPADQH